MTTSTFRNTKYGDLGETWCRHQTARMLSRHLQLGKHCRLDLDALLAGIARMLSPEIPDGMPGAILREPTIGDSDDDYRASGRTTTGSKVLSTIQSVVPGRPIGAPRGSHLESKY